MSQGSAGPLAPPCDTCRGHARHMLLVPFCGTRQSMPTFVERPRPVAMDRKAATPVASEECCEPRLKEAGWAPAGSLRAGGSWEGPREDGRPGEGGKRLSQAAACGGHTGPQRMQGLVWEGQKGGLRGGRLRRGGTGCQDGPAPQTALKQRRALYSRGGTEPFDSMSLLSLKGVL